MYLLILYFVFVVVLRFGILSGWFECCGLVVLAKYDVLVRVGFRCFGSGWFLVVFGCLVCCGFVGWVELCLLCCCRLIKRWVVLVVLLFLGAALVLLFCSSLFD